MVDRTELMQRIADMKGVWVRLYDSTIICLVEAIDNESFKGKFIPCANNAREYRIRADEVKEYYARR